MAQSSKNCQFESRQTGLFGFFPTERFQINTVINFSVKKIIKTSKNTVTIKKTTTRSLLQWYRALKFIFCFNDIYFSGAAYLQPKFGVLKSYSWPQNDKPGLEENLYDSWKVQIRRPHGVRSLRRPQDCTDASWNRLFVRCATNTMKSSVIFVKLL